MTAGRRWSAVVSCRKARPPKARRERQPRRWRAADIYSTYTLRLTPEELAELGVRLDGLIRPYLSARCRPRERGPEGRRRRRGSPVSALRGRDFRRLWIAGLISDTGDWLLLVSLPILVYQYTHSTLGTAVAFLLELAPPVLLAPLAAWIANRFERRATLVAVSAAQAVLLAPLLLVHGRAQLPLVYVVVMIQSALAALFEPAKNVLLPALVAHDRLLPANSLIGLGQNLGRLIGGSLGGLPPAIGGGLWLVVVADGASFLVAAWLIAGVGRRPGTSRAPSGDRGPAARNHSVLGEPRVRAALLLLTCASVAQGIFVVLYIVFVARLLHGGAAEIGLLRGVQAIGAIASGLVLACARRLAPGSLTAVAAIAFGLLDLAIWNAPRLTTAELLYAALFIAAGVPGTGVSAGLTSFAQQVTGERQRGAAFAAAGVAMSVGQAAGMLCAGLLTPRLGLIAILDGQAGLYLLAGALAALTLRSRRAHDSSTAAAGYPPGAVPRSSRNGAGPLPAPASGPRAAPASGPLGTPASGPVAASASGAVPAPEGIEELATELPRHISHLARMLYRATGSTIPRGMRSVLFALSEEPLRISDVAESEGIGQSAATRMVGRLEALGLVRRQRSSDDRRVVMVTLTERGLAELEDMREQSRRVMRAVLAEQTARELSRLSAAARTLDRLERSMRTRTRSRSRGTEGSPTPSART